MPMAQASSLSRPKGRQIVEAMDATCSTCSILVQMWSLAGAKKTCVLCLSRENGEEWIIAVVSR